MLLSVPSFSYVARNAQGERVQGKVQAISAQAARASLQEMSLLCEELTESIAIAPPGPPPLPTPPPPPALHTFQTPTVSLVSASQTSEPIAYYPLTNTLRLYAGWLLSWYVLIFALGSYQFLRPLPFEIPFMRSLFQSPLVISFALGAFLFLLLSDIHRKLHGGTLLGMMLTVLGLGIFVIYKINL